MTALAIQLTPTLLLEISRASMCLSCHRDPVLVSWGETTDVRVPHPVGCPGLRGLLPPVASVVPGGEPA